MEPTIKTNELIYVDWHAYKRAAPQRWDVIAFTTPTNSDLHIFRIWGLPGETISLLGGKLQINGTNTPLPTHLQPAIKMDEALTHPMSLQMVMFPYTISSSGYFVVGDNLGNSFDSRYWGEVPSNSIVGRVEGK